ncbi:MAG: hypothetical protein ACRETN_14595 [Nevskiales bacterium]
MKSKESCKSCASLLIALVVSLSACHGGSPGSAEPPSGGSATGSQLPPAPQTTNRNIETPYCALAPTPEIGITEIERRNLSERTLDIALQSKAMQKTEHILLTLPTHYDASGATRYPVLYLLHGSLDDHRVLPRLHGRLG